MVCHKTGADLTGYFTRGGPEPEAWELNALVDAAATVIFEEERDAQDRAKQ